MGSLLKSASDFVVRGNDHFRCSRSFDNKRKFVSSSEKVEKKFGRFRLLSNFNKKRADREKTATKNIEERKKRSKENGEPLSARSNFEISKFSIKRNLDLHTE